MIYFIWQRFSYVIILLILGMASFTLILLNVSSQPKYEEITVNNGDTLWTLAERFEESHDMTKEEFIIWVEKENNLSTLKITAGESLIVPIEERTISNDTEVQLALNEDQK